WLSYHVLTTAWLAVGAGTLALGWRRVHPTTAWVTAIGALVLSLVVRGVETDPAGAGWSAIIVLCLSGLAGALALCTGREHFVYASGLLVNLAGTICWLGWDGVSLVNLALAHIAAFAAGGVVWSLVSRTRQAAAPGSFILPYRHVATLVA